MERYKDMITKLRCKVSEYMTRYSDINSWESIRQNYLFYSYITFLTLAIKELGIPVVNLKESALRNRLEGQEILDFLFCLPGVELLIQELAEILEQTDEKDVNALYQEFLSVDYVIHGNEILFNGGKNNRDVLGSYYTQEDFAYEVVKKSIDDYLIVDKSNAAELRIADFSCGGGAFLVPAYHYCISRKVTPLLYGVDVDPIAVMITRARLAQCCKNEDTFIDIKLGNPLIQENAQTSLLALFKLAAQGRFYSQNFGLGIHETFDIIVGNPPWEKIRFEEKKFLQHYITKDKIELKLDRTVLLKNLIAENKTFYHTLNQDYQDAKTQIKKSAAFEKTNCGELNTYALFTELCLRMLNHKGISGLIIKSSLVKMPIYSKFFKDVTEKKYLYELYMFTNRKKIFHIDSREEFSVLYLKKSNLHALKVSLNLEEYKQFYKQEKIELTYEIINLINPDTGMLPNIKNNKELQFLIGMYRENKTFGDKYRGCKFGRLVHLTNHSDYVIKKQENGYEAVYEGKFIELYTGKYATFKGMAASQKYKNKATARQIVNMEENEYPEARYFIEQQFWKNLSERFKDGYMIAWRSLTSATNRRTMLATILPFMPTCQSIQILQTENVQSMLHILALFNSVVFDYTVRLKMAGLDLTQAIIKQIPVPDEAEYKKKITFHEKEASITEHINSRLYVIYKNDIRIKQIFQQIIRYDIRETIERKQLIAEIDMLISYLYGIDREMLQKIVSSFDKYYTKEEAEKWF